MQFEREYGREQLWESTGLYFIRLYIDRVGVRAAGFSINWIIQNVVTCRLSIEKEKSTKPWGVIPMYGMAALSCLPFLLKQSDRRSGADNPEARIYHICTIQAAGRMMNLGRNCMFAMIFDNEDCVVVVPASHAYHFWRGEIAALSDRPNRARRWLILRPRLR